MLRRTSAAAAVLAAVVTLTACGGSSDGSSGSEDTLKVAIFPTLSGPLAVAGEAIKNGTNLAVDQINAEGGVDGRKVEVVELVSDGTAAKTQQLVRRAVQRDGVKFVSGIISTPEVAAIMPQLQSLGAVLINSSPKGDEIPAACNANVVDTTQTNSMSVSAVTTYLKTGSPVKKWSAVATDTASGRAATETFIAQIEEQGGSVDEPIYVPYGTTDFGTVVSTLKKQGQDGLFSSVYGSDSVALLKQATQFGVLKSYKTIAGQSYNTDQLWESIGDPVVGTIGNIGYTPQTKNALNDKFVTDFTKKYGSAPTYSAADAYVGMQALFAAVEKADSTDVKAVNAALHGLELDTINGPVTIRKEDGLMIRPEYAGEVVKADGKFAWKVLQTVPGEDIVPPVKGC